MTVVVVGGGNAGIEAAAACAKRGVETLLITKSLNDLGHLPCNSSIGGSGKSQLLREMDVLGCIMTKAADLSSIHNVVLRTSKGATNYCLRSQVNRFHYKCSVRNLLSTLNNLTVKESLLEDVVTKQDQVVGIWISDGFHNREYVPCGALILTVGTFLGGAISQGTNKLKNRGRIGDSVHTANCTLLDILGEPISFKTSTSPLLCTNSIDFSQMTVSPSSSIKRISLFSQNYPSLPHRKNFITYTSSKINHLVQQYYKDSSCNISSPRYCISLDKKIKNFPSKNHQIFVQPEDVQTYINVSILGDQATQRGVLNLIPGLQHSKVIRYGYSISYKAFNPRSHITLTYASTKVPNIFMAGQINGTSGYEEAACQGLLAGINASLLLQKENAFVLDDSSYMGTLTHDLQKGITEPYRILPSNCGHRFASRYDNAHLRMYKHSKKLGMLTREEDCIASATVNHSSKAYEYIKTHMCSAPEAVERTQTCSHANKDYVQDYVAIQAKLSPYIKRFATMQKKILGDINVPLNADLNYLEVPGLSKQAAEALNRAKPSSLHKAKMIANVRAADIEAIWLYRRKQ